MRPSVSTSACSPRTSPGSRAHARMLVARGILSSEDGGAIDAGLDTISREIESGDFTFSSAALEDIHMNIEVRLAGTDRRCGGTAAHGTLAQ